MGTATLARDEETNGDAENQEEDKHNGAYDGGNLGPEYTLASPHNRQQPAHPFRFLSEGGEVPSIGVGVITSVTVETTPLGNVVRYVSVMAPVPVAVIVWPLWFVTTTGKVPVTTASLDVLDLLTWGSLVQTQSRVRGQGSEQIRE